MSDRRHPTRWFWIGVVLILAAAGAIGVRTTVWGGGLETHEVFVAQTAREMLTSGDPIVPTFAGELRLKKPPLMYWLVAGVGAVSGGGDVEIWMARLPSALSFLVLCGATIAIGAATFDRVTALFAGAMVALSSAGMGYCGSARPEMLYAACCAVMILGFLTAWQRRGDAGALAPALAGWAGAAAATLAKGPHLPALILAGLSAAWIAQQGWRSWARTVRPISGLALTLAIAAPWVIGVILRVDGALGIWTDELFTQRLAGGQVRTLGVTGWFVDVLTPDYLVACVSLLLPLGVAGPIAFFVPWAREHRANAAARAVFWALVVPMTVLSLIPHSRAYYALPLVPVLSVLTARGVLDVIDKASRARLGRVLCEGVLALLGAGAIVAAMVLTEASSELAVITVAAGADVLTISVAMQTLGGRLGLQRQRVALLAAIMAWGGAMPWIAGLDARHDTQADEVAAIAHRVAEVTPPEQPVLVVSVDPDDIIYPLGRPAIGLPGSATPSEALAHAPATLVAPPEWRDSLHAAGGSLQTFGVFPINDDEQVIVMIIARRPANPDASRPPSRSPRSAR